MECHLRDWVVHTHQLTTLLNAEYRVGQWQWLVRFLHFRKHPAQLIPSNTHTHTHTHTLTTRDQHTHTYTHTHTHH
jgi:hypothetical protein